MTDKDLWHVRTYANIFENGEVFSSVLAFVLRTKHIRSFRAPKTPVFTPEKTPLQSGVFFLNAEFSFACGRTKRKVFEYDDVIDHKLLAWTTVKNTIMFFSMLLWVVFQVNLTFVTLQELHRTMRKLQGYPTDLFLKIYALQENFCWLAGRGKIICLWKESVPGKWTI